MRKSFYKLENLPKYESMQWWDIEFANKYYDLIITSRGLSATQTCKFLDEDLNLQWLIISTKCTIEWLNVIKEQKIRMLQKKH